MKEFEETIKEINNYLDIDPSAILNNANSTEEQKMKDLFKMTLTASLQKQQENGMLEEDFKIQEFVDSQCEQLLGDGAIQLVPPILFTRKLVDELKNLKGDDLKRKVQDLFSTVMHILTQSTAEKVVSIMLGSGLLIASIVGMGLSIVEILSAVGTAAGIVGLVVSSIGLISSIASLIFTIFNTGNRSFFGLLINDSPYDISIEGNFGNAAKNGGARDGVFLKHGSLNSIFASRETETSPIKPLIQGVSTIQRAGNAGLIAVGLFMLEKNSGVLGSEGIFRLKVDKPEHHDINLMAACCMQSDNRMMTSFFNTDQVNYKAYDYMYSAMKGKTEYTEDRGRLFLRTTINDSRNSPAYGIASITQQ